MLNRIFPLKLGSNFGFCEYGNEHSCTTIGGECAERLSGSLLRKKIHASRSSYRKCKGTRSFESVT
jgi:hypothetical protein